MNRLVFCLACTLALPAHAWEYTDQTLHDDYLDKVDGASVSLSGMRIVVRVYNSSNSGTNSDINIDTNGTSSTGAFFVLNTAGDNLERNHIDTFWYDDTYSDVTRSQLWADRVIRNGMHDPLPDWFQYDTVTFTNFGTGQTVWVDRDDVHPSEQTMGSGSVRLPSTDVDMYALRVHTDSGSGSETDGKVYARLVWADGDQTDWLRLDNPWNDDFERDEDDLFFLPAIGRPDGTSPVDVELWHKSSTRWTVDRVQLIREVPTSSGVTLSTVFDVSDSISVGSSCGSSVDGCSETRSVVATDLSLIAETGTRGDAGSDSSFYARLKLGDGSYTTYKQLDLPGNTFEEKAVETFTLHAPTHALTAGIAGVEIKTTGGDGWRPRSIQLKEGSTSVLHKTFSNDFFRIDDDCDSDVTDGCAPRVLITTSGALQ